MDVHPPEHPITSWRDFFLHLATITVGLLIALSLEGMVEWAHHRELVNQARENLRVEMEANRRQATDDLAFIAEDEQRTKANIQVAKQLRDHPQGFDGHIHSSFSWSSPTDSAWQTAHETGALSYMPYGEVQRYTDIYRQQQILSQVAIDIFTQQTHSMAPLFVESTLQQLTPAELGTLLRQQAETYTGLVTLGQMVGQLRGQYAELLGRP